MAAPMGLMLASALWATRGRDVYSSRYEEQKLNQQEEDMAHKPTVTVAYDDYHQMQKELQRYEELARKHTVSIRQPNQYYWTEAIMVTPNKALKEFTEKFNELSADNQRMQRVIKVHEEYIDYLEKRGLWDRIFNKKS